MESGLHKRASKHTFHSTFQCTHHIYLLEYALRLTMTVTRSLPIQLAYTATTIYICMFACKKCVHFKANPNWAALFDKQRDASREFRRRLQSISLHLILYRIYSGEIVQFIEKLLHITRQIPGPSRQGGFLRAQYNRQRVC